MPARASAPPRPAARARRPRAPRRASRVPRASPLDRIDPAAVVARLAEAALASPLVLKRCDDVRVVVDADLARDVRVDWSAAMAMRGVVLTRPARGEARLTLDGRDFENFLRHPLARRAARDETFEFERGDVASDDDGYLECDVVMRDGGARRTVRMRPGEGSTVRATSRGDGDETLERALETFFERLVLDLDGTELRYRDMTIDARATAPTVTFELDLCVKRFPSPGIRF